ncbi:MAG: pyridoxamine 5'-phosphate oxidase [Bacteroidetes bacterium]|nr:pyridoxamine 5'-phosphate oxidase [Bacteroidota bacterium]MBX7045039.1 pyridoxamine 5'-phosphate oxidase [Ignavibacteria bacterium]
MNYADLRREYISKEFDIKDTDKNPFVQFENWFAEAMNAGTEDVNAFILSTCSKEGKPSSRIMLLKGVDDKGFVFYTNYLSRKSKELIENPNGFILFFFKELHRQIRIEGIIEKVTKEESKAYFDSRPAESRIGAWASIQSSKIESRKELEDKFKKYSEEFSDTEIPLPDYWGGFRLIPDYFEFWQGRENRLHDRICYEKTEGGWNLSRLSP